MKDVLHLRAMCLIASATGFDDFRSLQLGKRASSSTVLLRSTPSEQNGFDLGRR
jgi:hypothetical protein